jgi:BASS family bile acid:Na+ symporter
MDPQKMLVLALMVSIMVTVFGFGLRATFDDLLYLVKRPGLLLRTLLSMYVIMPVAALLLVQALSLDPRVELALLCLAISPVPPLLPNKAGKVAEEGGYAIALVATMALLSIIIVPVAVQILARVFDRDVAMSSAAVAATVVKTAIAPLVAGIIVRTIAPGFARKIAKPLSTLGVVVLLAAVAILLVKTWSGIMALATPPTLLAIPRGRAFTRERNPPSGPGHGDRDRELPRRAHRWCPAALPAGGRCCRDSVHQVGKITSVG